MLADDSLLIRDGLQQILGRQGVETVGLAATAVEAIVAVRKSRPDAVILDMRMPPSFTDEGLQAAEAIRREYPAIGILVLAQNAERGHVERLLGHHQRAIGYLLKDRLTDWDDFAGALFRVASGGTSIDPIVVEMLVRSRGGGPAARLECLTDRERAVLALMAEGLSNQGIADRMSIGVRTVEFHIRSVFGKLDLQPEDVENRRVAAVLQYLRARTEAS